MLKVKMLALFAVAGLSVTLSACGGGDKTYDISPVFPLTANKCAKYHGDEQGSGISATCMVTKDECERAAADWRQAMESGGVNGAIEFSCT